MKPGTALGVCHSSAELRGQVSCRDSPQTSTVVQTGMGTWMAGTPFPLCPLSCHLPGCLGVLPPAWVCSLRELGLQWEAVWGLGLRLGKERQRARSRPLTSDPGETAAPASQPVSPAFCVCL